MQKMRRWFERNDGIPPRGDTSPGFDMGNFWQDCCRGTHPQELFAAALTKSPKMRAAHEAHLDSLDAGDRADRDSSTNGCKAQLLRLIISSAQ